MITKYIEWDNETKTFIKKSVDFIIDSSGFVVNNYSLKRVNEDHIYDLIDIGHGMDIDDILDVLESKMPPLNTLQQCAISKTIWYLNHHQLE